jgi:hypothetical protein
MDPVGDRARGEANDSDGTAAVRPSESFTPRATVRPVPPNHSFPVPCVRKCRGRFSTAALVGGAALELPCPAGMTRNPEAPRRACPSQCARSFHLVVRCGVYAERA